MMTELFLLLIIMWMWSLRSLLQQVLMKMKCCVHCVQKVMRTSLQTQRWLYPLTNHEEQGKAIGDIGIMSRTTDSFRMIRSLKHPFFPNGLRLLFSWPVRAHRLLRGGGCLRLLKKAQLTMKRVREIHFLCEMDIMARCFGHGIFRWTIGCSVLFMWRRKSFFIWRLNTRCFVLMRRLGLSCTAFPLPMLPGMWSGSLWLAISWLSCLVRKTRTYKYPRTTFSMALSRIGQKCDLMKPSILVSVTRSLRTTR